MIALRIVKLVALMNDIYQNYFSPLQNFFLPTMKILSKNRIGGRIIKRYDIPKTPFHRLLDCSDRESELDPIDLQLGLEIKLKEFFNLVRQKPMVQAA